MLEAVERLLWRAVRGRFVSASVSLNSLGLSVTLFPLAVLGGVEVPADGIVVTAVASLWWLGFVHVLRCREPLGIGRVGRMGKFRNPDVPKWALGLRLSVVDMIVDGV